MFEMYPIGLLSLMATAEKAGFKSRILNLAVKMLMNDKYDPEKELSKNHPLLFAVDLHWLPHVHGALALGELLHKIHPEIPVLFGGLSSTYYHQELIQREKGEVDFVLRGDSTETPFLQLLELLDKKMDLTQEATKKALGEIPNLSWREFKPNSTGKDPVGKPKTHVNPFSYIPPNLDQFSTDYGIMIKSVVRSLDLKGHLPYRGWNQTPYSMLLTFKGCTMNCITCGGSSHTFSQFYCRKQPVFREPATIVKELQIINEFIKGPIFLIGDFRIGGPKWVDALLGAIKQSKIDNPISVELFYPAPRSYLKKLSDSFTVNNIELSPDSHDPRVRSAQGRTYTNEELEKTIKNALELGWKRFEIFFMFGLPQQTPDSCLETVEYSRHLLETLPNGVYPFIAPLAPFLDPGSLAFENPKQYGYRLLFKTLEEHRLALTQPSWEYFLNYETDWMTRKEIVDTTYLAGKRMAQVKSSLHLITEKEKDNTIEKLEFAEDVIQKIRGIMDTSPNLNEREERLKTLEQETMDTSIEILNKKVELYPDTKQGIKIVGAGLLWLKRVLNR
jgi:B12-binding domain/radical SAM domain protein